MNFKSFMGDEMKTISIIFALIFNLNLALALDSNSTVDQAVNYIETELDSENYALGAKAKNINLFYLKDWPKVTLEGLYTALEADEYLITDADNLGVWINYVDRSGEFSLEGVIYRSFKVELQTETLYVVIYNIRGGEWSREEEFKLAYILDSKGLLLSTKRI
jgi:hypothetical protein